MRKLGSCALEVSALSLGCMGTSEFYAQHGDVEAIATFDTAHMASIDR